jgi:hypothetical protein
MSLPLTVDHAAFDAPGGDNTSMLKSPALPVAAQPGTNLKTMSMPETSAPNESEAAPPRRGKRAAKNVTQRPGCLPEGFDLDSQLTVKQFAIWQQIHFNTAYAAIASMKGVFVRSREWVRINPRTFIDANQK